MTGLKSLCVYCGSRMGDEPIFADAATQLGKHMAKEQVRLVYGGGKLGLMGTVAGAARDHGGDVYGIIPKFLVEMEGILEGVDHEIVETMHERKMMMFEQSDAICTLPGGIGTLEEIIEVLSWARLDLHRKPVVLLNIGGFWSPLVELLNHIIDRGFAAEELRHDIVLVDKPEDVIPAAEDRLMRSRL
ncbi:TIGR00730 family Rossman fold protein [Parvularcula sp. IMCC14364]|uniref:LOG family protein n=1 Tax=Parvularcula sp. IMCC14364 TaxID=3067902 RepID=UPI002741B63A|nr:TIGR00730 family Rossman fold protein [Parvularcula sp. IMCC14364]